MSRWALIGWRIHEKFPTFQLSNSEKGKICFRKSVESEKIRKILDSRSKILDSYSQAT